MDRHIEAFLEMLAAERGAARNTIEAYRADLQAFAAHAAGQGESPSAATENTLHAYMASLHGAVSARTAARRLSSLRGFCRFLVSNGVRPDDPSHLLDTPRLPTSLPRNLTEPEVDALLAAARAKPGTPASWPTPPWKPSTPPACGCPNSCPSRAPPWASAPRC